MYQSLDIDRAWCIREMDSPETSAYQQHKETRHVRGERNALVGMVNRFVRYVGSRIRCKLKGILFGVILDSVDWKTIGINRLNRRYKGSSRFVVVDGSNVPQQAKLVVLEKALRLHRLAGDCSWSHFGFVPSGR